MKYYPIIAALIFIIIGSVTNGYAQTKSKNKKHDDRHIGEAGKGPHGGTIEEATPYLAEILANENKLYVFFLDANGMPMTIKGISGNASIKFADGTIANADLVVETIEGFLINTPNAANYSQCTVTATVIDKTVIAKFTAQKIPAGHQMNDGHGHQH